jgi:hypothetical protein
MLHDSYLFTQQFQSELQYVGDIKVKGRQPSAYAGALTNCKSVEYGTNHSVDTDGGYVLKERSVVEEVARL